MTAYYNENDPFAAQMLRNLIADGRIAPGDVDERSIEDVRPSDLDGYTQCHFFAGIGVWSYALRQAGWPDDRPVWTGSCPCQPFSASGKRGGFADERHLWPAWHHLVQQRRPAIIFGEQVASKAVEPWIDLVQADVEALGYAFGCVPFPAAGVGAPHIRDRAYWVGVAGGEGLEGLGSGYPASERYRQRPLRSVAEAGESVRVADAHSLTGRQGCSIDGGRDTGGNEGARPTGVGHSERPTDAGAAGWPSPTNGHWGAADWLFCRDGKWRPVEPGTFPLVDGAPARVGRLRAYGNAIVAQAAQAMIEAYMEDTTWTS